MYVRTYTCVGWNRIWSYARIMSGLVGRSGNKQVAQELLDKMHTITMNIHATSSDFSAIPKHIMTVYYYQV